MRIYATARATPESNAVGQVELECTLAGLEVGLYGVGTYRQGYAVGIPVQGTRLLVPWSEVKTARASGEDLYLEFTSPRLPHNRLTLTRFSPGPGVPWTELRKRRLLLHSGALAIGAAASVLGAALGPHVESRAIAWGALGYGALAGCIILALGYSLDTRLFLRPPDEGETKAAFLKELEHHYTELVRTDVSTEPRSPLRVPPLVRLFPRTATVIGITLAASILTALVTSQKLLRTESQWSARSSEVEEPAPRAASAPRSTAPLEPTPPITSPSPEPSDAEPSSLPTDSASAPVERRCICDRADSPLWKNPIPRLSSLLLDQRRLQTRTSTRTRLEIAAINNGDSPISDITLLVQFYEHGDGKRSPTQDRPLYFEGPLRPGQAIKWTTEARGSEFEISTPDVGQLGVNGDGAAPADSFYALLDAKHRPVRLHAARMLGFLGDSRARDAAIALKEALRSAEAPYLRRVLVALGDVRICDIEIQERTVGACVFNAGDGARDQLGIQLQQLSHSLDVNHPLANPPELRGEQKWLIPGRVEAQAGVYVRVPRPQTASGETASVLELLADRYDLLE